MTKYQSEIKTISSSEEVVFGILSDLNHLEKLKNQDIASGKLKVLECNADSCLLELEQVGRIGFRIVEKDAYKSIKLESFQLAVEVSAWIRLEQVAENETKMGLTLSAILPPVLKMMLNKKLERGINLLADFFEKYLNTKLNS